MQTKPNLIVGTDGSPAADRRVREAARAARALSVPLHVVCSVASLTRGDQRKLDDHLPGDMTHFAGASGQREAAIRDVRSMVGGLCELHISASALKLGPAVRHVARRSNGEIYGARERRLKLRLPVLGLRTRATA